MQLTVYPSPILRQKSEDITVIDDELRQLVEKMLDTMYEENGVGLAAPQVGINKRVIVIDVSEERNKPEIFINPCIDSFSSEKELSEEGCLVFLMFMRMLKGLQK